MKSKPCKKQLKYIYFPISQDVKAIIYLFIDLFTLYLTLIYKLKIHTFISKLKFEQYKHAN